MRQHFADAHGHCKRVVLPHAICPILHHAVSQIVAFMASQRHLNFRRFVAQEASDRHAAADGGAAASNGVRGVVRSLREMVRSRRDDGDGTPAERGRANAPHRGSDAADDGVPRPSLEGQRRVMDVCGPTLYERLCRSWVLSLVH